MLIKFESKVRALATATMFLIMASLLLCDDKNTVQAFSIYPFVQTCEDTKFYDTTLYTCQDCGDGAVQNKTSGSSCECPTGFVSAEATRNLYTFACLECDTSQQLAPNQNATSCLPCGEDATYDDTALACICPLGYKAIDYADDGTVLEEIQCEICPPGEYRGPNSKSIWECEACENLGQIYDETKNPYTCICDTANGWITSGDGCVKQTDIDTLSSQGYITDNALSVTYYSAVDQNDQISQLTVTQSDVFTHYYLHASVYCQTDENPQACQQLANLCVLQLYDETTKACQLFRELAAAQPASSTDEYYAADGWKQDMPWLYYSVTPEDVLKKAGRVDLTVSFYASADQTERTQYLTYQLARYSIDGTFQGFQQLQKQLTSCPMTYSDVIKSTEFGVVTKNQCTFFLKELIDQEYVPVDANAFFELYVQDRNGNLVDIPVLITNFRNSEGQTPNEVLDYESSRLVRRFFIYDTISGINNRGGFIDNAAPSVVRVATDVKLTVQLDPDNEESIFTPLLTITYKEKATNLIEDNTKFNMEYFMDYYEEYSAFWNSSFITLIVLQVLVVIVVLMRMYNFVSHNPQAAHGSRFTKTFLMRFIYVLTDTWANTMYWMLFYICMYFFIMYKLQDNAYLLLPSTDALNNVYSAFRAYFFLVLACKLIAFLASIAYQSTVDIFLIDWEPTVMNRDPIAWRSTFVANEYNELMTEYRRIYPITTIVWFGFLWVGLGLQYFAQTNPQNEAQDNPLIPFNGLLKFFWSCCLFWFMGIIQFSLYLIKSRLFEVDFQQFVDLCTLSNISVLILDEHYHGYYIHGKAPWEKSDLPISWIKKELDFAPTRGINQNDDGNLRRGNVQGQIDNSLYKQTFEIYISKGLRDRYDKLSRAAPRQDDSKKVDEQNDDDQANKADEKSPLTKRRNKKDQEDTQKLDEVRQKIKDEESKKRNLLQDLKHHIEIVTSKNQTGAACRATREWSHRLLGNLPMEFNFANEECKAKLVFDDYERYPSYMKALYCALDFDWLILCSLLFNAFDFYSKNPVLSLCFVYIVDQVFVWIRSTWGESNLSKKTMTDDRFLL